MAEPRRAGGAEAGDLKGVRILVVEARFYDDIADALLAGATRALEQAGAVFDRSGKSAMPDSLRPVEPHTHNALDDAVEQGELFANLMDHAARRRFSLARDSDGEGGEPSWLSRHVLPIA